MSRYIDVETPVLVGALFGRLHTRNKTHTGKGISREPVKLLFCILSSRTVNLKTQAKHARHLSFRFPSCQLSFKITGLLAFVGAVAFLNSSFLIALKIKHD